MQTSQTNTSLRTETSASMRVFGNNDLTGVIMSFYASGWGLRPPSLVSRGFKGLVRARVRSSLYMCNCNGLWRVCLATGGVEYLAETPFGNPDDEDDYLSCQRATTVDGAVVVTGGWSGPEQAWRFDPIDSTWRELPSMLRSRAEHSMASVGGRIFALGGKSTANDNGCVMECLDVRGGADSWQPIGPQDLDDVAMQGGTGSGNFAYRVGGWNYDSESNLAEVHRMNASTGAWEVVAPMNHPRRCLSVCGRSDGDFYALGGLINRDQLPSDSSDSSGEDVGGGMRWKYLKIVERYLAGENRWITLAPMRADGKFIGASVVDGCLWAVTRVERAILLDKYDPSVDAWVQKHALPLDAIPFIKFGPPHARGYSNTFSGFA